MLYRGLVPNVVFIEKKIMMLQKLTVGFARCAMALMIGIGNAQALPCAAFTPGCFNIENTTGSTGWHIEYDPAKVIDPSFFGTPRNDDRKDGDLDLDHVFFNSLNPIEIKFFQDRDAPGDMTNFGLRITLRFDIANDSGSAWKGFTMRLSDELSDFDTGDAVHPGFAHFHSLVPDSPQSFAPFSRLSPDKGNPNFSVGSSTKTQRGDVYLLGNGIFDTDLSKSWTGIGIHEWENPFVKRNFTLLLTPTAVPEPGTLGLLCIGLMLMARLTGRKTCH